jgi:hypothetical protein
MITAGSDVVAWLLVVFLGVSKSNENERNFDPMYGRRRKQRDLILAGTLSPDSA